MAQNWLQEVVATGTGWDGLKEITRPDEQKLAILESERLSTGEAITVSEMSRVKYRDLRNYLSENPKDLLSLTQISGKAYRCMERSYDNRADLPFKKKWRWTKWILFLLFATASNLILFVDINLSFALTSRIIHVINWKVNMLHSFTSSSSNMTMWVVESPLLL